MGVGPQEVDTLYDKPPTDGLPENWRISDRPVRHQAPQLDDYYSVAATGPVLGSRGAPPLTSLPDHEPGVGSEGHGPEND